MLLFRVEDGMKDKDDGLSIGRKIEFVWFVKFEDYRLNICSS